MTEALSLEKLVEALQGANLVLTAEQIWADVGAESILHDDDIADALWLMSQMGGVSPFIPPTPTRNIGENQTSTVDTEDLEIGGKRPNVPRVPAYLPNESEETDNSEDNQAEDEGAEVPPSGLPIQVQAAAALPNARLMSRSLRPLMRKVPSRVQMELDEAATVDLIAREDVWLPVLRPARERWFDLELVIEVSSFTFIWTETLSEFQRLLELQGAFRTVRTWWVEATSKGEPRLRSQAPSLKKQIGTDEEEELEASVGRSHKELMDASGRSLVLYLSDCRSGLWQQGHIHDWLREWSQQGPTAVAQLLPERLWTQTALDVGHRVQVSAFMPGVCNDKLRLHNAPSRIGVGRRRNEALGPLLTLPVVSLTPGAMQQWARVVAAMGQQRLPARLFDLGWIKDPKRINSADWMVINPQEAPARVELFEATASAPAIELARYMSILPLELPVVHLLQQTVFKERASATHVAEVYDSCLLQRQSTPTADLDTSKVSYRFAPDVRKLLNRTLSINETFKVWDAISQEINHTLGPNRPPIRSFMALLSPAAAQTDAEKATILPFAEVATDVMKRLGPRYAAVAGDVEREFERAKRQRISPAEDLLTEETDAAPEFRIPPLEPLPYVKLELVDEAEVEVTEAAELSLKMDESLVATISIEEDGAVNPPETTRYWAFLVGVNNYRSSSFSSLKYCVNDVLALQQVLEAAGYEVVCLHDSLNQEDPLFPDRADNVLAQLRNFCQKIGTQDILLVYFASHVVRNLQQGDSAAYLVLGETVRDLPMTALKLTELIDTMTQSPAPSQILLLDGSQAGLNEEEERSIQSSLGRTEGFMMLTACSHLQQAHEAAEMEHGVFTNVLLSGLSDETGALADPDDPALRFVTTSSLSQYVVRTMKQGERSQECYKYAYGRSDFVLADYRDRLLPKTEDDAVEQFKFTVATLVRRENKWVIQRQPRSAYRFVEHLTTGSGSAEKKQQLFKVLRGLSASQFSALISALTSALAPSMRIFMPPTAGPEERASALLQWVESSTDSGLSELESILQQSTEFVSEEEFFRSGLNLEIVSIPGDTFLMGSPLDEEGRGNRESPQHEVTIPSFFMGRYPVTQAQWRFVANLKQVNRELEPDPSRFKGDNRPVEKVSWSEAVEFCDRLSRHTNRTYRLPSEAEWEYACRAGSDTPFHFGETISSELANYRGTSTYADGPKGEYWEETTPVDHFGVANSFGLSDMHGNVLEWCQDHYHESYEGAPTDGSAWLSDNEGVGRIRRGGSWLTDPWDCRSAYRFNNDPDDRDGNLGFRVVCVAPSTLQTETR